MRRTRGRTDTVVAAPTWPSCEAFVADGTAGLGFSACSPTWTGYGKEPTLSPLCPVLVRDRLCSADSHKNLHLLVLVRTTLWLPLAVTYSCGSSKHISTVQHWLFNLAGFGFPVESPTHERQGSGPFPLSSVQGQLVGELPVCTSYEVWIEVRVPVQRRPARGPCYNPCWGAWGCPSFAVESTRRGVRVIARRSTRSDHQDFLSSRLTLGPVRVWLNGQRVLRTNTRTDCHHA